MNKFLRYGVASLVLLGANLSYGQTNPLPPDFPKISPISTVGNFFATSDGKRFEVIGTTLSHVDEDAIPDPISDDQFENFKTNILPKLQALKVNAIRVFNVDPTKSHDKIMALLAQNNIYVLIDVVNKYISINRFFSGFDPDPNKNTPNSTYNKALYDRGVSVVNAFAQYPNVMSFEAGNELIFPGNMRDSQEPAALAACKRSGDPFPDPSPDCIAAVKKLETVDAQAEKSFIRDLKDIVSHSVRPGIPVGIALQDGPQISFPNLIGTDVVAQYYACGNKDFDKSKPTDQVRADYIGFNTYAYVPGGNPNDNYARFANLAAGTSSDPIQRGLTFQIPLVFTESGGRSAGVPTARDWKVVPAFATVDLYNKWLSGEFAFGFFNTQENLGLYCEGTYNDKTAPTYGSDCASKIPFAPTPYGGADNLISENSALIAAYDKLIQPTASDSTSQCPTALQPPLLPSPGTPPHLLKVEIDNYANGQYSPDKKFDTYVRQNGIKDVLLTPGSGTDPTKNSATIDSSQDFVIQATPAPSGIPGSWQHICTVPHGSVNTGTVVGNDIDWSVGICNCTPQGGKKAQCATPNTLSLPKKSLHKIVKTDIK